MTTTIRIVHNDVNLVAETTYTGNQHECADFAQKFTDFVSLYGAKVQKPHWSGLTRDERDTARQTDIPDRYGGSGTHSGKIPAIKMHRERTGVGLRDSKDAIEAYLDGVKEGKEI